MPEKFMILAVTGFVAFVFIAALLSTFLPARSDELRSYKAIKLSFYLSLLVWLAIVTFLYFAHPFIYLLDGPLSLATLFDPRLSLLTTVAVVLLISALSTRIDLFGGASNLPFWWSPVPLALALTTSTWFSLRMSQVGEFRHALWPDWRFIGVAAVLYGACLVLGNLIVWLTATAENSRWNRLLAELTRLSAILPALLVYSMGLRV